MRQIQRDLCSMKTWGWSRHDWDGNGRIRETLSPCWFIYLRKCKAVWVEVNVTKTWDHINHRWSELLAANLSHCTHPSVDMTYQTGCACPLISHYLSLCKPASVHTICSWFCAILQPTNTWLLHATARSAKQPLNLNLVLAFIGKNAQDTRPMKH